MPERTYALSELQKLREWRGFTQQQLAEKAGVSVSAIQKHERGVWDDVALSVAAPLARELDVPIEALFLPERSNELLEQVPA